MKPKMIWIVALVLLMLGVIIPKAMIDLLWAGSKSAAALDEFTAWLVWWDLWNVPGWKSMLVRFAPLVYAGVVGSGAMVAVIRASKALGEMKVSATWAKKSELKEFLGADGVYLTKNIRINENTCYGHVLVVGPTGSGKTVSYFLPNLFKLDNDTSVVVTDPKGELYQKTAGVLEARGWTTKLIKLDDKMVSENWNPLDVPQSPVEMTKVVKSLIINASGADGPNQGFISQAEPLAMALVYAAKSLPGGNFGNLRSVAELVLLSFDAMYGMSKFAAASTGMNTLMISTAGVAQLAEATRTSVAFFLKAALAPFLVADISAITANSSFDLHSLKSSPKPVALFVSVPEHKVEAVKAVLATLYMQIFDTLLEYGKGGHAVRFFLDEFANSGKILGFPQYIATIRSRRLSVSVCLQSIGQLTRVYGDAEKKEILNNLKTMLILPAIKEDETLDFLSKIAGKVGYMERDGADTEKRAQEKERLPVHEIRGLEDNYGTKKHEAIVFMQNKNPYRDMQLRSYADPAIRQMEADYPECGFPMWPEEHYTALAERCFFTPARTVTLERVGVYLAFNGDSSRFPEQLKVKYGVLFKDLLMSVGGAPKLAATSAGLNVEWKPATDSEGLYAQIVLEKTIKYLHQIGDWKVVAAAPVVEEASKAA